MDIQFNTHYLTQSEASGDTIPLKATHPEHIRNVHSAVQGQKSFGQMLFDAINEVNTDQQFAHDITVQAVSNPDSVEPHDVTIALSKANLSLSITQSVLSRVVQAYRDISTLR